MKAQYIKDNFYKISTIVAILLLIALNGRTWVSAQDAEQTDATPKTEQSTETNSLMGGSENMSPNLPNIPNATCLLNYQMWDGGSSNYNPNAAYNNLFTKHTSAGGTSSFQDVNGDNLPDYIYSSSYLNNDDTHYYLQNSGCVYLNNGNGWAKAFVCNSNVKYTRATGAVVEQRYQGDCAGAPSASEVPELDKDQE